MELLLQIHDLKKSYGERVAVCGVGLEILPGEMFGLVGPDGAGKTTLVRVLCGILPPDEGSFTLFGLDGLSHRKEVQKRIGYLSQKFSLYGDLTVNENIAFFARIHNIRDFLERRDELLRKMDMAQFGNRLADKLSGGMKQKLALACTLIHFPEVLFLDEPTTGVDPVSRREFWQILSGLKKEGLTILVTTPYMDEAERCDRVAFIHEGRILQTDTPRGIKRSFERAVVEVICDNIAGMDELLRGTGRIESIQPFGDRLHLIFDENTVTEDDIRNTIDMSSLHVSSFRRIDPSLEDIFTVKMQKSEASQ